MRFSPKTVGVLAAIVTVAIWTAFIVIARATAHRSLTPLVLALLTLGMVFGVRMQAQRGTATATAPDLIADGADSTRAKA